MLDELRGNDYLSRGTRKQQRTIESAVHKLEQKLGRAPVESEIAAEMEMSLTEYQELLGKVRGTQLVYLEDMAGDDGDNDFLDRHVADEGAQPAGAAAGPAHARGADRGDQGAARARAVRDEHVLRARHEPEGDRRGAEGDRVARLPAAQPVDRAPARQAARVLIRSSLQPPRACTRGAHPRRIRDGTQLPAETP